MLTEQSELDQSQSEVSDQWNWFELFWASLWTTVQNGMAKKKNGICELWKKLEKYQTHWLLLDTHWRI